MDDLAALRLLLEWGADEALADLPLDRFVSAAAPASRPASALASPAAVSAVHPDASRPAAALPARGAAMAAQASGLAAAAASLDALHDALDGFDGCPLRVTATSTVRPSGNPASRLVLVAEAPGADDDRTGSAFSGPPGQALDQVLASIGLDRGGILLTHLVPWRPPGNRAPNEAEVQACLPFLHRLLALTQPRRLLLLGGGPARALAGATEGVRRLRGRWLPVATPGLDDPAQALSLLPLEQWMRSAAGKRALWADLLELRQSINDAA